VCSAAADLVQVVPADAAASAATQTCFAVAVAAAWLVAIPQRPSQSAAATVSAPQTALVPAPAKPALAYSVGPSAGGRRAAAAEMVAVAAAASLEAALRRAARRSRRLRRPLAGPAGSGRLHRR
jgi:hypothetical protein